MNVLEKKLVCEDCWMTELSFFETEVTLPVRIDHIVTKDLYCTLNYLTSTAPFAIHKFFTSGKEQIYA